MKVSSGQFVGIAIRVMVAAACCLGIWYSWQFARADILYRRADADSTRGAIRLVPDGYVYYIRLAQLDPDNARNLLQTALRLNRYNAQAYIDLALQYEADLDLVQAEKFLLDAYAVDHTYLPRWSLANFYFRQDNMPAFWSWARSAASMPSDNVGALFELCWRASPDPDKITSAILNDKPELIRQYIDFLVAKKRLDAAAGVAPRLVRFGSANADLPMLLDLVNRLIKAEDGASANSVWHSLRSRQWVAADNILPNNPGFERDPLPVGFDWLLPQFPGMHSWPGASGLEIEFDGTQPEECYIALQSLALQPGSYTLHYSYKTRDIAPGTGIHWLMIDTRTETVVATSDDLSSDTLTDASVSFTVPDTAPILRLQLEYKRAIGTPRISGMLIVRSSEIIGAHQP